MTGSYSESGVSLGAGIILGKRKICLFKLKVELLTYHWLKIRMEQHISIWVNSKVVAIWSKLKNKHQNLDGVMETSAAVTDPVFSYGKARSQPLDIFERNIDSHNPQNELVWRFLKENRGRGRRGLS